MPTPAELNAAIRRDLRGRTSTREIQRTHRLTWRTVQTHPASTAMPRVTVWLAAGPSRLTSTSLITDRPRTPVGLSINAARPVRIGELDPRRSPP